MGRTKAEQETILLWNRDEQIVRLYAADPAEARRWTRLDDDVKASSTRRERPFTKTGRVQRA